MTHGILNWDFSSSFGVTIRGDLWELLANAGLVAAQDAVQEMRDGGWATIVWVSDSGCPALTKGTLYVETDDELFLRRLSVAPADGAIYEARLIGPIIKKDSKVGKLFYPPQNFIKIVGEEYTLARIQHLEDFSLFLGALDYLKIGGSLDKNWHQVKKDLVVDG